MAAGLARSSLGMADRDRAFHGVTRVMKKLHSERASLIYALAYLLVWIPYIGATRVLASQPHGGMAVPLTGLAMLPLTLIFAGVSMGMVLWLNGWWKSAHCLRFGPLTIPVPGRATAVAGLGATLILTTVPLSFTFPGVSIPFIQVLMRGDALIAAPLVDWLMGRKAHWYSRVALLLVAAALAVTIQQRGGLRVPALCLLTIVLNLLGYFLRLMVMTRLAKNDDPESRKRYFVEEQMVAYPLALVTLGGLAWAGRTPSLMQLRWGFTALWSGALLPAMVILGAIVAVQGLLAAMILLGRRENTYCVPLERSASVIGGVIAAYALWRMRNYPQPTSAEMIGVGLLICAIVLLSIGPSLERKPAAAPTPELNDEVTAD